jgi:hypothetical protein
MADAINATGNRIPPKVRKTASFVHAFESVRDMSISGESQWAAALRRYEPFPPP